MPLTFLTETKLALPGVVIENWSFLPETESVSVVLPDGCRDLIVKVSADGCPHWFVSELADTAYEVCCQKGEAFVGYRFHAGAEIREHALLKAVQGREEIDASDLLAIIDDYVRMDRQLAEALVGLSEASSVAAACSRVGVSERSLERLVIKRTGRTPGYWKSLARARRAAGALPEDRPLAEIAADHGYADQAHMSREFGRWFAVSPGRLRNHPALLARAMESGYP